MQQTINKHFIEIDCTQIAKRKQHVCGDFFISKRFDSGSRLIAVLADGLGSGIKASVLATLTGTMAIEYASKDTDIEKSARMIHASLPVCEERKIAYSTYSICDLDLFGQTRVIEFDNPSFLLIREGKIFPVLTKKIEVLMLDGKTQILKDSSFSMMPEDRLILFSDGVTQAGIGNKKYPLGFGLAGVANLTLDLIALNPNISASELSHHIVNHVTEIDGGEPKDDTSCAVIYVRSPRKLLIASGPPFHLENDALLAQKIKSFQGEKVICGGTTASIVAREWKEVVKVDIKHLNKKIPPFSTLKGSTLVTEGSITLSHTLALLESNIELDPTLGEHRLAHLIKNSDHIEFLIGTRINEAHQDPRLPKELEIRRSLIKQMTLLLEETYLKSVKVSFI